jgi:hypothetical protein
MEGSGQHHVPVDLPPEKSPHGTHWKGGWVILRIDLDAVEKRKILPLLKIKPGPFSP